MQPMQRRMAGAIVLGMLASASMARAQEPSDLPSSSTDALAGTEQHRPYWRGSGPIRPFLAANFDLGAFFVRPWMQVGYGKPHYEWFGAELYESISTGGGRGYAGLRAVWPFIDIRAGARYEYPLDFYFMARKDAYDRVDLEDPRLGKAHELVGEAEIAATIPVPNGSIVALVSGYAVIGVPDDRLVFDPAVKVITESPWLWRGRLGYLYHLGWQGSMKLGVAVEAIHLVQRENAVVRAGPLFSVALTHHMEANAAIMVVAYSPDELGLVGADLGQLGLRYRFATGDRFPEFP